MRVPRVFIDPRRPGIQNCRRRQSPKRNNPRGLKTRFESVFHCFVDVVYFRISTYLPTYLPHASLPDNLKSNIIIPREILAVLIPRPQTILQMWFSLNYLIYDYSTLYNIIRRHSAARQARIHTIVCITHTLLFMCHYFTKKLRCEPVANEPEPSRSRW